MRSLHKLLAALTVMAFMLGYLPAQQVHAAEIIVTTTADSGPGSLRQAVLDATIISPGDTITFAPGLAGQTILLTSGQIIIGKDLTIDGSGLDPHVKISGNNAMRVFNVTGSFSVNIWHLDIINGNQPDGGGIYNSASTLTITDVTFSNNSATNGGAIFNSGNLQVTDSTFSNNSAALGGAIYHFNYSLAINKSTFSGNTATSNGGAIYNSSTITGITGSKFSNNGAGELTNGEGGAIYNNGTIASIATTTFSGNKSDKNGGGIYNNLTITSIALSTFSGNNANSGSPNYGDGGGIYNNGTIANLERSTFSGNSANGTAINGGDGGGINNSTAGSLLVVNSTFSRNGAHNRGGGIMSEGQLTVTNATFSGNGAASGGGIAASTLFGFNLTNTILANSTSGGDCYILSGGPLTTDDHNLIKDTLNACGLTDGVNGDIIGADPQLGPLAYNGFGIVKTYMLKLASPALDAGIDIGCPAMDQRGKPRPVDGDADGTSTCDIGAVERQRTLITLQYRSQAPYDGEVLESGENSNVGGKKNNFDFNMKLGDDSSNRQFRSFLSFNTKNIPDRAVVSRVVIKAKSVGGGKFPFNSKLLVDIRKGPFSGNRSLQSSDFQAPAHMNASGSFRRKPLAGGWYKVILQPASLRYVNKKGLTQFRLRFKLGDNNNFRNDYIMFYTGDEDNKLYRPLLIVQYYLP